MIDQLRGLTLSALLCAKIGEMSAGTLLDAMTGRLTRERSNRRAKGLGTSAEAWTKMRLEVQGAAAVRTDRSWVYMSNHQSHLDIPVLFATCPSDTLRMVAKKELFSIPLFGPAMRKTGFICVDRSNREAAIKSLELAAEEIREGVSIWIAPEGTRSPTGKVGKFKKGGFHLAKDTNTPIIPVAIDGTRHILPKGTLTAHQHIPVRVTYGEPLEVEGRNIEDVMADVRAFFEANVSQV